jgi:3-phosphoshikimate 1-carboxyvinyltransferase
MKVEAPSSKSMTQRALVIAALCDGPTLIERPLHCDDSRYLSGALAAMGCAVAIDDDHFTVTPGPLVAPAKAVFCGNAGTAVRFGSCLSLVCKGPLTIDGNEHMRRRPIGPLGDCLEQMGVAVSYLEGAGCPPIQLTRNAAPPQRAFIDTSLSSQYASGLLMVAPRLERGLEVELTGALVSMPYIDMTVAMMQRAGAEVERDGRVIRVAPGCYRTDRISIETDWSAAAFLLAAERILGRTLEVVGLAPPEHSLQGDSVFVEMLARLDAGGTNEFDLTDAPDLIAPLAAACLFASKPTIIRGAAHTRVKECDRVAVLCSELRKLGADMQEHDDGLDMKPLASLPSSRSLLLDPHDDHRMAMAFGLVSLEVPAIEVANPDCVSKSFPSFWKVLSALRACS